MAVVKGDAAAKEKMKKFVRERITELFTHILDYSELVVDKERFQQLRSKVLRVSNDAIRHVDKEIDYRYAVDYIPQGEDVVIINRNGKGR